MKAFSEAVKWVFLDLDNTLWDFDANAEEAIKETANDAQTKASARTSTRKNFGA